MVKDNKIKKKDERTVYSRFSSLTKNAKNVIQYETLHLLKGSNRCITMENLILDYLGSEDSDSFRAIYLPFQSVYFS